jgi:phospholipase C
MEIKHLFVLMMENRSFDHLLGFSNLEGISPPDPKWGMTPDAPDRPPLDPLHEFEDVKAQIAGDPPMSGFSKQSSYWNVSRQGFSGNALPVLTMLARKYCLFDNWYASMPGPTWPNRFFVHAASSGGLDNSPSGATSVAAETIDSLSFTFQHGTLYERLAASGRTWRIYHDDFFPQVLAIKHMVDPFRRNTANFSWLRRGSDEFFVDDLSNNYGVDYTFIEPNYGLLNGSEHSNCQHPKGAMSAGEAFIKYIYESIRNSPVWPQSLLIVTYDEHGGFFDAQPPPPGTAPGDDARNQKRAKNPQGFAFDKLGVRVPTIAVSPWIAAGTLGSKLFPNKVFDHSAIVHTAMDLFGVAGSLTARDAAATSLRGACSLTNPRIHPLDAPMNLPTPTQMPETSATLAAAGPADPPESILDGFSRIAMSLDLSMEQATGAPAAANVHPSFADAAAPATGVDATVAPVSAAIRTNQQTLEYIRSVARRVDEVHALDSPRGGS